MKKKMILIVLLMGCLVCIVGCGSNSKKEPTQVGATETPKVTEQSTETPEVTEQATETPEITEQAKKTPEATEQAEETPQATEQAEGTPRDLNAQELDRFTQWAQAMDHYGLLMSNYTDPRDADLNMIFYSGAGLDSRQLTEDEKQAYLEITGNDDIYTDCAVLSSADIDRYLKQKLGISLDDVATSFEWTYLPLTDVWVAEHGDTNYTKYQCTSGKMTDADTYVLEFEPMESDYFSKCETTLKMVDGDYQVLQNVYQ